MILELHTHKGLITIMRDELEVASVDVDIRNDSCAVLVPSCVVDNGTFSLGVIC